MEFIHGIVNSLNDVLWSYVLIVLLLGLGLYFTLRTNFVQLRMLPEMLRLLTQSVGSKTNGHHISSFQAFCISTASRVGTGNIAGVAIAIVLGGPGAVFWMWIIAFLGSATGFVESTLAQIYKIPNDNSHYHGGPAYYISNALHQPSIGKLFAVLLTVTFALIYNSVQSNTIALSLEHAFGVPQIGTAVVLTFFTGIIIFGGAIRIAKVTEFLVPIMAVIYILTAIIVIVINIASVPEMLFTIVHDAFSPQAAVGGGLGGAILMGIKRGLFSNEAGEGSVPNAAATANVSHPVKQGLIQALGVFVDTWLVCTATAFIVLLAGQYTIGGKLTGVALTQESLASIFGSVAPVAMACMILMFAFSSIVGNYFYGEINVAFMSRSKTAMNAFRTIVLFMVFFGSVSELSLVWDLADLFMAFLTITNLYAIARLFKYVKIAFEDYQNQKKKGITEPVFDPDIMPDKDGIYAWKK